MFTIFTSLQGIGKDSFFSKRVLTLSVALSVAAASALCVRRTTSSWATERRKAARRVFASIERYLTRKLKLVINQQKSRLCSTDGVEFLGFEFQGYGGQFRVAGKNLDKFKSRVRKIPGCNRGVSFARRCVELRDTPRAG